MPFSKQTLLLLTTVVACVAVAASASSSSSRSSPQLRLITSTTRQQQQQHVVNVGADFNALYTLRGGAAAAAKTSLSTIKKRSSPPPPKRAAAAAASKNSKAVAAVSGGTASIPNEIFNLVKAIVGAGVLGLPAGIAAFGNAPSALIPASALILATGILSGFGFWLIGIVCAATGSNSYRQAWANAVSPETSWIPTIGIILVTSCAVTGYSMILSDTAPLLLAGAFGVTVSRTQALLGVTLFALLPLCLLKNLKSLSPFSLAGITGVAYTFLAMAGRYLTGSYKEHGALLEHVAANLQPKFGTKGASSILHPNAFLLLSMLSTAYVSHYNAPRFYQELQNNTIPRFSTVVLGSFSIALFIFLGIASFGFLTFGENSAGFILNNYAKNDTWMSWSRLAVALSILFSYPLAFVGVRDGVLDILQVPPDKRTDSFLNTATISLLAGITGIAYVTTDIRFIMALSGSSWGNAITYLFPTFMVLSLAFKKNGVINPQVKWIKSNPIIVAAATTGILGSIMAVVGLSRALSTL